MNTPIQSAIHHVAAPPLSPIARKLGKKRAAEPVVYEDPIGELRRLVQMHKRWTNVAKSWEQSVSDRTIHETGEVVRCTVPEHVRVDVRNSVKALRAEAKSLESAMSRQLRGVPIYEHFLSHVYGMMSGPVVAAYIVSMVKIERAVKVSQLIRYCGNANDPATGRRELRASGPKYNPDGTLSGAAGTYNDELKMRLWQFMSAMYKNAAKKTADRPNGTTSKYLKRWTDAVHFRETSGREKGAFHAGRRKATDLFLWDLYVVWRTLEGLPVWPDKWATECGFFHGGQPVWQSPRVLTLEQALTMVGEVGPTAA